MNIFITGGAGFIGVHCANHFLSQGHKVTVFDNFSRRGTRENARWLRLTHEAQRLNVIGGDVRNWKSLTEAIPDHDVVIHLAAQVAVTSSVENPRRDFEVNALGTFNILEAVRSLVPDAIMLFASTNKVYGGMEEIKIIKTAQRYVYQDLPKGIPESQNLDFHSPYGNSKGAADQYTRDYHRIYGLRTVVFRQSCIFGTHQFGISDQGWVSWFTIAATLGKVIMIFGDGMQVRDVLFVDDLIRAYEMAITKIDKAQGKIYNIGGGPDMTLSLLELVELLESKLGKRIYYDLSDWRPGDQPVYISDISKIKTELGWQPEISVDEGTTKMIDWIVKEKEMISQVLSTRRYQPTIYAA